MKLQWEEYLDQYFNKYGYDINPSFHELIDMYNMFEVFRDYCHTHGGNEKGIYFHLAKFKGNDDVIMYGRIYDEEDIGHTLKLHENYYITSDENIDKKMQRKFAEYCYSVLLCCFKCYENMAIFI